MVDEFCSNCGIELDKEVSFCSGCGEQIQSETGYTLNKSGKIWYHLTIIFTIIYFVFAGDAFLSGNLSDWFILLNLPLITMYLDLRRMGKAGYRIYDDAPPIFWVIACGVLPLLLILYLYKRYYMEF